MKTTYSSDIFVKVLPIHIIVTIALPVLAFVFALTGLSGSSNAKGGVNIIEFFAWIWTTGPMVAWKIFGLQSREVMVILALGWSIIFSLAAGYLIPMLGISSGTSRSRRRRVP